MFATIAEKVVLTITKGELELPLPPRLFFELGYGLTAMQSWLNCSCGSDCLQGPCLNPTTRIIVGQGNPTMKITNFLASIKQHPSPLLKAATRYTSDRTVLLLLDPTDPALSLAAVMTLVARHTSLHPQDTLYLTNTELNNINYCIKCHVLGEKYNPNMWHTTQTCVYSFDPNRNRTHQRCHDMLSKLCGAMFTDVGCPVSSNPCKKGSHYNYFAQ
jgi:hypothetical protein